MTDLSPRERRERNARALADALASLEYGSRTSRTMSADLAAVVEEDRARRASTASTAPSLAASLGALLAPADGPREPVEALAPTESSEPEEEAEAPAQEVDTSSASTPEEAAFLRALQS